MLNLTPRQIVTELDRYIIGQNAAKRSLAIAARNFWRMRQVKSGVRPSLLYRNILMIGPTGSGKTSLTRYFADVIGLSFFHMPVTQIVAEGYRGCNISDLIKSISSEGNRPVSPITLEVMERYGLMSEAQDMPLVSDVTSRPSWMIKSNVPVAVSSPPGLRTDGNLILLDEFDKLGVIGSGAFTENRFEVQRELLALLEDPNYAGGSKGYVNSDLSNSMIVCAGAFADVHEVRRLIPELQGRLPSVVELTKLDEDDYVRILQESKQSPIAQINQMLSLEGVQIDLTETAIRRIANAAFKLNESTHNLGVRRLHNIAQKLFEDISFRAPELAGQKLLINDDYFLFGILEKEMCGERQR